ncbi:sodium:solute symporter family protein [Saccharicrinis sp. FJH62]|uniref:sodium:solute symporter family protein n=1 Tax=Saccharicrinis sp. FJH62 TaxID=3344657 RepID=UPI0035D4A6B2
MNLIVVYRMHDPSIVIIICCIYFAILILAGIYASRKNKRASDYLIAGQKLNLVFTIATLSAVQIGAGIILGGSANGETMGIWPGMWYALGCGGGLILAGIFIAGKLRKKDSFVPLDFYELRYGRNKWVRVWAWASNVPSLLGIFVAQLLACGSILSAFGIPFYTGVIICAIVILIYSTLGGMWGVAIADSIHTFVIIVSIPVLAIASALLLKEKGILLVSVMNTPFIPAGMFAKFVYLVIPFLIAISVSYDAYIRYQSAKNAWTAKWGCIIAGIVVIIIGTLASLIGAIGHYIVPNAKEGVFSAMVIQSLNPVFAGVVIAAMLGAAMSSASGLLVAMGATFSRDLYNRFLNPEVKLDDLPKAKLISRLAVGLSAVAGILLSFKVTNILDAIIIFNYPYMGSLLVPLLAGVLWKGATKKGAVAALFTGGVIGVGSFLAGIPGPLANWVNPDMGLFYAYFASLIVLIVVSITDKQKYEYA